MCMHASPSLVKWRETPVIGNSLSDLLEMYAVFNIDSTGAKLMESGRQPCRLSRMEIEGTCWLVPIVLTRLVLTGPRNHAMRDGRSFFLFLCGMSCFGFIRASLRTSSDTGELVAFYRAEALTKTCQRRQACQPLYLVDTFWLTS